MTTELTITCPMHFTSGPKGQREMRSGRTPPPPPMPVGRVPHVAKLMALAVRLDRLLINGDVKDMAELGRIGHVSRARVSQILNLRFLAPDIQEAILFLPPTLAGRDAIKEWQLRPIAGEINWKRQRRMWDELNLRFVGEGAST